jgi:hypothetical protein
MRQDEPVETDKRRKLDLLAFSHFVGKEVEVGRFLVVFGIELEPAGVP